MRTNLEIFCQSTQQIQSLHAVRSCIKMALNVKMLQPELRSLDWEEFVSTLVN